jgi:hypothetical protein
MKMRFSSKRYNFHGLGRAARWILQDSTRFGDILNAEAHMGWHSAIPVTEL